MTLRLSMCAMTVAIAGCSAQSDQPEAPVRDGLESNAEVQPEVGGIAVTGATEPLPARVADDAGQSKLAIDPEGLRWFMPPNGAARPLPFGMTQADTLAALERLRGKAAQGTNADCGAGPVQYANWADGLSLAFQNGRFAGWSLDGRAAGGITTADGIGIGTTRAELDAAIGTPLDLRETSIGTEFTAGGYYGLIDGRAENSPITDIWAGVSCVVR